MIHKQVVQKPVEEISFVECDCCHHRFDMSKLEDQMEIQEFVHIDFVGGFGSVFGDCVRVKGDFCQWCVRKLLGEFLRREERKMG